MARTADVVIVGGGIAGIATAYYLAEEGASVSVIERDGIGSHASGFAYGGVGHLGRKGSPGPNDSVARLSSHLHAELRETLPDETGIDIEYRVKPVISLAFDDVEAAAAKADIERSQREFGSLLRWATTIEAMVIEPRINPEAIGAVINEQSRNLHPHRLTLAIARAAEARGVIFTYETVTGLKRDGVKLTGISLENGTVDCGSVVLATGPWMGEVSKWLGFTIPVTPLKGQILRLRVPGPPVNASIGWGSEYATSKPDGLLWTGSTEEEVGFDEQPTEGARDQIIRSVTKMLPFTRDSTIAMQTACLRPVTPDRALVLGEVPGWERVYVATGGARSGIMLGPGIGRVTADLVLRGSTDTDIAELTVNRFL